LADVRIFRPSKNALQSGLRKTHSWQLEFERRAPRVHDPLMGWIGSSDTQSQVRLRFDTREEAIAFCEKNGWSYEVQEPPTAPPRAPKSYADNFRRPGP
jgi:hypothetical protein